MIKYYTLLTQQNNTQPKPTWLLKGIVTKQALEAKFRAMDEPVWHYDLETTGLEATDPALNVTVLGVATSKGCGALDTRFMTADAITWLLEWMRSPDRRWVAFNQRFDAAWMFRLLDHQFPKLGGCSLMLWRLLTSEGHDQQSWSLNEAQQRVLGWDTDTQKQWLTEALRKHKLPKARMSELLTKSDTYVDFLSYCAIDAEASRQLWDYCTQVIQQHLDDWGRTVWDYHQQLQLPQLKRTIVSEFTGMQTNVSMLLARKHELQSHIHKITVWLETQSAAAPYITEFNEKAELDYDRKRTKTKKTWAKKSDEPWLHPDIWAMDDNPKAVWEQHYGGRFFREHTYQVELSSPPLYFNWNSGHNLGWLLYTKLYTSTIANGQVTVNGSTLPLTQGGNVPTGKGVLGVFGDVGQALLKISKFEKELTYVKAYLESPGGIVRPKLRPGSTINGRCSG